MANKKADFHYNNSSIFDSFGNFDVFHGSIFCDKNRSFHDFFKGNVYYTRHNIQQQIQTNVESRSNDDLLSKTQKYSASY